MENTQNELARNVTTLNRRSMLRAVAGAAVFGATWSTGRESLSAELKGRINQSVCLWCYNKYIRANNVDLDTFAAAVAKMGIKSIELVKPDDWPTLKKHGLCCAMTPAHGIAKGLNRVENHEECLAKVKQAIDDSAAAGFPNAITMSGNREGMDDEEGLKNCATALKRIAPYAEKKKVTVCLEFLNSAVDHTDYMADSTKWCVQLVHRVGSPRVKVLYDIYHAAVMGEYVLKDIQDHHDCWGHFHTGGVPGRNEIDDTQTLDYAKLMRAIVETGYTGYVGQEFIPKRADAMESLRQAVTICDV